MAGSDRERPSGPPRARRRWRPAKNDPGRRVRPFRRSGLSRRDALHPTRGEAPDLSPSSRSHGCLGSPRSGRGTCNSCGRRRCPSSRRPAGARSTRRVFFSRPTAVSHRGSRKAKDRCFAIASSERACSSSTGSFCGTNRERRSSWTACRAARLPTTTTSTSAAATTRILTRAGASTCSTCASSDASLDPRTGRAPSTTSSIPVAAPTRSPKA